MTTAMELPRNNFKRALAEGRQQIGLWSSLSSHYSVEVIAGAGYDWLLLDMEHSPNDLEALLAQLQAAAPYPAHPVVRVPWNDAVMVKRVLDIGAQSLLIPYVSTVAEAKAAVAATRYPPAGVRGVAGTTRATRFGRIPGYAKKAHEEICVLVQVETKPALDNLEAICAVEGVDGVFIGPADLAAGLGHLGDQQHAEVQSAIQDAIKRIRGHGKPAGILATDDASTRRYMEWGTIFTAVGLDAMVLARETEKLAAKWRPT